MKVHIYRKKISKNRSSLFLDFYPPIKHPVTGKLTRREFLGMYILEKPRTPIEREQNKATLFIAEKVRSERQIDIQAENYGFLRKKLENRDLLPFFKEIAENYKLTARGDKNNWMAVYNYLFRFCDGVFMAKDVSEDFCLDFKEYIQRSTTFVSTKNKLANNSAVGYFNIFRRMIKIAYDSKKIEVDFAKDITSIRRTSTRREFLTLEEVRILAQTHCDIPVLKKASIFSALTGLRYSDIEKLTWQEIYSDDNQEYTIQFIQKKTRGVQTLHISKDAYNLLGERKEPAAKVFPGLLYSAWQNQKLQEWVNRAGIYRKITFHSLRHSYATIQLSLGTDITTIQEMLGHRNIQTTLIYAKVVNTAKREAANKMTLA
ncbi:MAG: hypothetical protein BGO69_15165 [Bacteroidetes bacterium 46-16]|nr:MAG: hypothetical protein BGO69_15165 [Bacteroidetes bacterium 46-16]